MLSSFKLLSRAIVGFFLLLGFAQPMHAQWSLTVLHPAGIANSGLYGAAPAQQVGYITTSSGPTHAGYWSGTTGSFVDLDPSGTWLSYANATNGTQQGGSLNATPGSFERHAYLWSGTSASGIDLHPAGFARSNVTSMAGSFQGGTADVSLGTPHAALWSGTAASFVDLHPIDPEVNYISSEITAMVGSQQAGFARVNGGSLRAILWNSSSTDFVYLHAGATASIASSAIYAMTMTQQGGVADGRAALWSGSHSSRVGLHPSGASTSKILAMVDGFQAGEVDSQAAVWQGTAESYEKLHSLVVSNLGSNYTQSTIRGAYIDGDDVFLVGYATDTVNFISVAVIWSLPLPAAPLAIVSQPESQSVVSGGSMAFSVSATGNGVLTYHWEVSEDGGSTWSAVGNDAIYSGAISSELSLVAIPLAFHDNRYRVRITDVDGTTTSNETALTVEYTELWGMGSTFYGQLGAGELGYHPMPEQIGHGYQSFIAQNSSSFFLKSDGTLWASGLNRDGELHDGTTTNRSTPVLIATGVTEISSNNGHTLFVKADHTLWGMGRNSEGQLGMGHLNEVKSPSLIASDVAHFSAGGDHSLYVKTDGTLWGMGNRSDGKLGASFTSGYQSTPFQIDSEVSKVFAGFYYSLFIKTDGTLWGMGRNRDGSLGELYGYQISSPALIVSDVKLAAIGRYHTLFLKTNGTLWSMGQNTFGQLGDGTTVNRSTPSQVASGVEFVTASLYGSFFIKTDQTLWGMGENDSGQLGDGTLTDRSTPVQISDNIIHVSAGRSHLIYQKLDGSIWAAGADEFGEFGIGRTGNARKPILIADGVTAFGAGDHHSLFVKSDGSLWAMGENKHGELGDGTMEDRASPVHIMDDVAHVGAGYDYSLVLKADGTLWGMGTNDRGQLGLGEGVTVTSTPMKIATGVSEVLGGYYHSLFIKENSTLWGMGQNTSGQLGDGTTENRFTPMQMASDVATATSGSSYTLFAHTNDTLMAAGRNSNGVFGNSSSDSSVSASFTEVSSSPAMLALAAGSGHSLFLHSDNTLWTSGSNGYGQLGRGFIGGGESVPAQVATGVASIDAGSSSSLFLKTDGSLWGMGFDLFAPFSAESVLYTETPTQFATGVDAISANTNHVLFLKRGAPVAPQVLTQPDDLNRAYGEPVAMEVSFSGFPTPTFQWKKNGADLPDKTSARLKISYPTLDDAGSYVLVASNYLGTIQTDPIVLSVDAAIAPSISTEPIAISKFVGEEHTFVVEASGTAPLTYQWRKDGESLINNNHVSGATTAELLLQNLSSSDSGSFDVIVSNHIDSVVSATADLSVTLPLPVITTQPLDSTIEEGATAVVFVLAESESPMTYQWQIKLRGESNWTDLMDDASSSYPTTLQVTVLGTMARHGAQLRCVISNSGGSLITDPIKLWINQAITLTLSGEKRRVEEFGETITFTATASSAVGLALSYQWKQGNRPIEGATMATFDLTNFSAEDAGAYVVEVSDTFGGIIRQSRFVLPDYGPTQVRGWGQNADSQLESPLELTTAIAMAAGSAHSVALKGDGTIQVWGDTSRGQTTFSGDVSQGVALSAYGVNTAALESDGTVRTWGSYNSSSAPSDLIEVSIGGAQFLGLRNDGTVLSGNLNYNVLPKPPEDLRDVAGIAAGGHHVLVCKLDGTVLAWGDNDSGQTTIPSELSNVTAVAGGERHSLALNEDGTVVAWGDNSYGQSSVPGGLSGVVSIAANEYTSIARKSDGSVVVWGRAANGETSPPSNLGPIIAIAGGGQHSLALRQTTGDVAPEITVQPVSIQRNVGETAVLSAVATGSNPLYYQWRRNGVAISGANSPTLNFPSVTGGDSGRYDLIVSNHMGSAESEVVLLSVLGTGVPPYVTAAPVARQIGVPEQSLELDVSATSANLPLTYQWKKDNRLIVGATNSTFTLPSFTNDDSGAYTVEITDSVGLQTYATGFVLPFYSLTQLKAWGGGLSDTDHNMLADLDHAIAIAAGGGFDFVILNADGTLARLGASEEAYPSTATDVVAIAGSGTNGLALKSDGTVDTWKGSAAGDLSPPEGLSGVISASMGGDFAFALKSDGTVVGWGINHQGQLDIPAGLFDVTQVSAGGGHVLALKTDGTVVAWGGNLYGQANVPDGLTDVVAVSAGGSTSFALKSDGSIVAWGLDDWSKQTTVPPEAIPASSISAGSYHVVAIKPDGTIASWGADTYAQQSVPADISHVVASAVTQQSTLVLRDASADAPPVIIAQPASVLAGAGETITLSVSAVGIGPFTYQWRRNGVPLVDQTDAEISLVDLQFSDAGNYDVVVTNQVDSVFSDIAVVTIQAPPEITSAPSHRLIGTPGEPLTLAVAATSANAPLSYQWRKNNRLIAGATTASHGLADFKNSDAGTYTLEITDNLGLKTWFICFVHPYYQSTQLLAWGQNYSEDTPVLSELPIVSVSAYERGSYAVTRDGEVVGFLGSDRFSPVGMTDVVAVAEKLVLKSDGTIESWLGDPLSLVPLPPSGLRDVVDLQSGRDYMLALKADGTVVTWGDNGYGQTNMPSGLSNVVQIAAGDIHAMALMEDGSVEIWGHPTAGAGAKPAWDDLSGSVSIAAGYNHSTVLKADGQIISWGFLGGENETPPGGIDGVAITAGQDHVLALNSVGGVEAWGGGSYDQTVVPDLAVTGVVAVFSGDEQAFALRDLAGDPVPPVITTQPGNQSALSGSSITFSVIVNSLVPVTYQWKKNGVDIPDATSATYEIPSVQLSDESGYTVVITNSAGSVTSDVATAAIALPPTITTDPVSRAVFVGRDTSFSVSVTSNAPLTYQWSKDGEDITGATSATYSIPFMQLRHAGSYTVTVTNIAGSVTSGVATLTVNTLSLPVITEQPVDEALFLGQSIQFTVTATGIPSPTYQWQIKASGSATWSNVIDGVSYTGSQTTSLSLSNAQATQNGDQYRVVVTNVVGQVISAAATLEVRSDAATITSAAGYAYSLFQRADGSLWASGDNASGQFADSTTNSSSSPISATTDVFSVTAGAFHTLVLKTDLTLWSVGANSFGQLGLGDQTVRSQPQQVTTGVVALDAGVYHSLFIKDDGSLWGMGYNPNGQLGNATTTDQSTPVQIDTHVMAMSAGLVHSVYVKTDGTAWATGDNANGQFGNGTTTGSTSPTQVATNISAVSTGYYHTLFLQKGGSLWASGSNAQGQLGDGTNTDRTSPVQVATNVTRIAAVNNYSLFLKADGTLWGMGDNSAGQLGTGATTNVSTPTQIASDVTSMSAGFFHVIFSKNDGTTWAVGTNTSGQLGDGTTNNRLTPVLISTGAYLPIQAPAGLAATTADPYDRVLLTWTPSPQDDHYEIWRSASSDGSFPLLFASGQRWPYYEDLTTSLNHSYYYVIKAVNATGTSDFGPPSIVYTGAALPLAITSQPQGDSITTGQHHTFTVVASGTGTLSYQWRKDGNPISGATSASYTVSNASLSDAGSYKVVVTDDASTLTSDEVTLSVTQATATVTLGDLSATYDGNPHPATATTDPSGLTVNLTYDGSATAPTEAGDYTVVGTIDDASYEGTATDTLTIAKAAQTITFAALADRGFTNDPITLSATASSGLPVSFAVQSGPATLSSNQLTLTGIGTVSVRASQSGNTNYFAAVSIDRSFVITASAESWLSTHFTESELTNEAISGALADPDGDGLTNLLEYALGLDPRSTDTTGLPEMSTTATDWVYTYTRPTDREDITYEVVISTDLSGWSSTGVTHELVSTSGSTQTWQATVPSTTGANLYFRLKISQD